MRKLKNIAILTAGVLIGCSDQQNENVAYGHFENEERIVSAELPGNLIQMTMEEGQIIKVGDVIAVSDTMQIFLSMNQVKATMEAVRLKTRSMEDEIAVLTQRKTYLSNELNRFEKLLKDSAATEKQVSDLKAEIDVVDKQIAAARSGQNQTNRSVLSELKPLEANLKLLQNQMSKSKMTSPVNGKVIQVYTHQGEFAGPGKPIVKIGMTEAMEVKVYLSGGQLDQIKTGDKVKVRKSESDESPVTGTIIWIADEAEFTPKNIQTSDEKSNLVYAVKVSVKNDGTLKKGMPAEVVLDKQEVAQ